MTSAAPTGGWIRRLAPYLLAHRRNVAIALGAAIGGQAVAAFVPVLQKVVVDDVIVTQTRPLWPWLLLLLVAALFSFVAAYLRRWIGGRVSLDVQFDLRNAIYERLQRLDFAGHDSLQTGQLVSRASSDLALIQGLLSFLPIMLGNVVMLVLSLIVMLVLSPALTAVMAITLPLLLVLSFKLRRTIFPATWDAQQRAGEVAGVVDEAVTGVRVVKGFGQEDREVARLGSTARQLYGSRLRLIRLQARYTPMLATVPALAQVAVLALGGWLAIEGRLTLGTFLAFSSYLVQLVAPVRMLASLMAIGQQARAGAERVLDILETNSAVQDRPDAEELPVLHGEVEFEDVRFGYTSDHPVLDGFDLCVRPGEVVALVSASGSGKSTVIALLPRFYDVGAGRVAIDGTDVRDVTLESLRRQVGVVFEDAFLFSDSVRANIAYGRPDATDADIRAAARAAGADGFIAELPDGYETVVGERGLTLSGGQRQRIALARAILTDPRILILDDATSSVDAATEEAIHATLQELMAGRTTILIAHRRSTLRLAQRIVVVDGGRVVDEGSHDDLMVHSALYRSLLAGPQDGAEGEPVPAATATAAVPATNGNGNGARRVATAFAAPQRFGPGANRNSVGGGPWGIALSATPELLAAVDRLPPIDDDPHVDDAVAAEAPLPGVRFRILRFVRPWWRWLVLGFALVVADAVLTLLGPFFIRYGIDHGVSVGDETVLWWTSAAFAVAVLLGWATTWGYTLVTGQTAERLLYALRVKIFAHLQRLSLDYYDREMAGRIMTRMTTDVDALSQLIQTGLINAVVGLLTCVGVFVFLIILSPPLALATAVVLPPLLGATWWYQRASSVAYSRARDSIASVNANLQESLSGVRVAQAYVREDRNIAGFRGVNGEYLDARLGAQRLIALYFPFVLLLGDLGAIVVLGTGAALVAHGVVTAGIVIAFLLYLDQFFSPIQQLSQVFDTWQQAAASVDKIEELLATPTRTPAADHPVEPGRLRGEIRLDGVHFRYPGTVGEEALGGVDVTIAPGETVALVGETGAGKSTIVKLIARFYDPTTGTVRVDGTDLRHFDLGAFRRQLGVVPQEAFLFTGTVRDNIAYGRPDATDAEIEAAARAVGAHDFVVSLPGGYGAAVSERGRSLSAGQRQLVALARAQLVDPAILLLDEATSQLDLASEARVQHAMGVVAAGRTTVLVAHRLPTARTADRILVVAGGRIVEQGSHDELLALDGQYAVLWAAFAPVAA